jgi:hypothetical protein
MNVIHPKAQDTIPLTESEVTHAAELVSLPIHPDCMSGVIDNLSLLAMHTAILRNSVAGGS